MSDNPIADHASYLRCKDRRRDEEEEHERLRRAVLKPMFEGLPTRQLARRLNLPLEVVVLIRAEERARIARELA